MDMKNMMMNKKVGLLGGALKWIVRACLVLACAQSAMALDSKVCGEGTIYLKTPATWTDAYAAAGGKFVAFTKQDDGWWTLPSSSVGQGQDTAFFISSAMNDYCQSAGITSTEWDQKSCTQNATIHCSVSGDLYIYENPAVSGTTVASESAPNAKYIYMMVPPDLTDWMSSVPMISTDGGVTGKALTADPDKCGWYSYVFFNDTITDNVVFYRDDDTDREDMIGLNGNEETGATATPIPLSMFFEVYNVDTLFFVPDHDQLLEGDTTNGWYTTYPDGVEGTCSYTMAAIIYDSDASLHPAFSCYATGGEGCQYGAQGVASTTAQAAVNACIGVTPGIVEDHLDATLPQAQRKPILSAAGAKCFISATYFNQLFNYTQGVNEKSCYDMPFERASDGKWEFDSDFYTSSGAPVPGGFYPVENSTDAVILAADPTQTPVAAARTKRTAEGPIFYGPYLREEDPTEGAPRIDLLCNGPGWSGGYDCTGLFGDGGETTTSIQSLLKMGTMTSPYDCVIGWSCQDAAPSGWQYYKDGTEIMTASGSPRWKSEEPTAGRNQQFCFESHAKFTQKPGLRFTFRGDDDIWVFIDNKLAVDLGGTHLAAPGYVDLDKFEGLSGALVTGSTYDLDIFFCDRRTTMSNVRIKTNMYIRQKTNITSKETKSTETPGLSSYHICYTKSGDGSCAAASTGTDEDITYCDAEIANANLSISYALVKGSKYSEANVKETFTTPGVYYGGLDLTTMTAPITNKNNLVLPTGRWSLWIIIDGKPQKIFSVMQQGEVDVVYKNGIALDTNGVALKTNSKYNLVNKAMGGEYVPVYISSVADNGEGTLDISPWAAVGQSYTLDFSDDMKVYTCPEITDECQIVAGDPLTIGESGVDTVYVTVEMRDLKESTVPYTINVKGQTNIRTISFYLPQITFVTAPDSTYEVKTGEDVTDPDFTEYWMGSYYDLYVAVLKPNDDGQYFLCTDCDLSVHMASTTSSGIQFAEDNFQFVNGFATITLRCVGTECKDYRHDDDPSIENPARIAVQANNENVSATYYPIYFKQPPVPIPVISDVFDVNGTEASKDLSKLYSAYKADEYLDGIADSVAIYLDRRIHKDSLPLAVCILWDSSTAVTINPYVKGYSSMPKDSVDVLCNVLDSTSFSCLNVDASTGYCDNRLEISGLTLSSSVKTDGVGQVITYAEFEDKGKKVRQGFAGKLYDRIAPIPLSATIVPQSGNENYSNLTIVLSEPVKLIDGGNLSALDFYLKSSTLEESQRLASAAGGTSVVISSVSEPAVSSENGKGKIDVMFCTNPKVCSNAQVPQEGDYVRLGGNLSTVVWSDTAHYDVAGSDTLRATVDAAYYWNSPTGYKETKRLPSPWVVMGGRTPAYIFDVNFAYTGNAAACIADSTCANTITPFVVSSIDDKETIITSMNGLPGQFVTSNMMSVYNQIIEGDDDHEGNPDFQVKGNDDFYFYYEVSYFTNLGNYVAGKSGKIYCDDDLNYEHNKAYYFGGAGHDCTESGTYFYIAWNMTSDKGREVGTGAYISKMETYVKADGSKKNHKDETSVFGVRKSEIPYTHTWEDFEKNNNISEN